MTITAGSETRIDIVLPRAGAISGRIFDETGEPLPYATVVLGRLVVAQQFEITDGAAASVTLRAIQLPR